MSDMSVGFHKNPGQVTATQLQASTLHTMLYGGSRSGKTFITIRNIIIRAVKKKSRHVILRFAFNHAKVSIWHDTLPKVLEICFPDLFVRWNKVDFYIELPNGSQIWLGGLDDKERVEKILGNEYSTIYLNECSQISWESVGVVMTRLAENSGLNPRAYYDCNPPSRKHWTYIVFIEHKDPATGEKLPAHLYAALQINPEDNKRNQAEGYIDTILAALPKRQRERFLSGLFTLDIEGALWDQITLDKARAKDGQWQKYRTVVGVDPATTNNPDSDEHGIIAASAYTDKTFRVEADYTTKGSPQMWATAAIYAYEHHDADAIIIETNQGGDMCESTLRNAGFTGRIIRVHASKGKFARAEPISALYEQNRVSHADRLDALEGQMLEWVPHLSKESPDRIDAMVWALTELSNDCITPTAGVFGR